MAEDKNTLELISSITEFNELHEYMKDDQLDKVSQEYYNSPVFSWLILQANPQFGGLENNIYDGAVLIIPFPLLPSLQDYKAALENHFYYYGR